MIEIKKKAIYKSFPVPMYSLKEEYIQQFKLFNDCICFLHKHRPDCKQTNALLYTNLWWNFFLSNLQKVFQLQCTV